MIQDIIQLIGGEGIYQRRLLLGLLVIVFIHGFFDAMIPFNYYEPNFICKIEGTDVEYKCNEYDACNKTNGFRIESTRVSLITIHETWCENRNQKSNAFAIINFGSGLICLLITLNSDRFGRKIMLIFGLIFILSGSFIGSITNNFDLNTLATLMMWIGADIFTSIGFVYFCEFSSGDIRNFSNSLLFISEYLGMIFCNIITIFLKNYQDIYKIIFFYSLLCVIIYIFLKESPYYLYSKNKMKKFKNVIKKIKNINQSTVSEMKSI